MSAFSAPIQVTDVDGLMQGGSTSEQSAVSDATAPLAGYGPNNAYLFGIGMVGWNTRTFTADAITDFNCGMVHADATSGLRTIYLPADASKCLGFLVGVKKIDSSVNAVVVGSQNSQAIDQLGTFFYLSVQYATAFVYSDGSTTWRIAYMYEPLIKPAAAVAIATGGTMTPGQYSYLRMAPTGAVTGIIMANGNSNDGRVITVFNESAFLITFAAQATSHVSNGVTTTIPTLTAKRFVFNGASSLWYPS